MVKVQEYITAICMKVHSKLYICLDLFLDLCASSDSDAVCQFIMHPPRGPKGRGVAPIGASRGVHYYFWTFTWVLYALGLYT